MQGTELKVPVLIRKNINFIRKLPLWLSQLKFDMILSNRFYIKVELIFIYLRIIHNNFFINSHNILYDIHIFMITRF